MRMRRHQRATASVLLLLTAVAFALTTSGLRGQVPLLINYQGRILSGSANFNGTGQFKFALLSPNGNFTYWTNDGTGGGSTQPTNAVSLTVTNGLYSILLGNTSIANMTALPTRVF